MKKLFVLLLFLMVPLTPLGAQGLHGKILLLNNSLYSSSLQAALKANYAGQVDSEFSLPSDLSDYDAILMVTNHVDSGTISISDQQRLIAYIKNGGKFYWEGYFFLTNFSQDTPQDTLARFLGLENEGVDALEYTFVLFYGVDSEFTNGFGVGHSYDTLDPSGGGTDFPRGNFVPVLYGEESDDPSLDDAIAWIPSDTSIHALMHHSLYFEYYQPFLSLVLCDYLGLCTEAVKEAPPNISTATLRVVNDGFSTSLVVDDEESGTLDISNALGATVYHASVGAGTSRIEMPESLRNGVYFARLQTAAGGQVQPFAILTK